MSHEKNLIWLLKPGSIGKAASWELEKKILQEKTNKGWKREKVQSLGLKWYEKTTYRFLGRVRLTAGESEVVTLWGKAPTGKGKKALSPFSLSWTRSFLQMNLVGAIKDREGQEVASEVAVSALEWEKVILSWYPLASPVSEVANSVLSVFIPWWGSLPLLGSRATHFPSYSLSLFLSLAGETDSLSSESDLVDCNFESFWDSGIHC